MKVIVCTTCAKPVKLTIATGRALLKPVKEEIACPYCGHDLKLPEPGHFVARQISPVQHQFFLSHLEQVKKQQAR